MPNGVNKQKLHRKFSQEDSSRSVKKVFSCLQHSVSSKQCQQRLLCVVYFNQEGKLVAKEYFDNEWKVRQDILGGGVNKKFFKGKLSQRTMEDRYLGRLECPTGFCFSHAHIVSACV